MRVVPLITNAIFGATAILVLEWAVVDVLRDGSQPLRQWTKLTTVYIRAVESIRWWRSKPARRGRG